MKRILKAILYGALPILTIVVAVLALFGLALLFEFMGCDPKVALVLVLGAIAWIVSAIVFYKMGGE